MDNASTRHHRIDTESSEGTPRILVTTPRRLLARESMASGLLQRRYLQPPHVWQWRRGTPPDESPPQSRRSSRYAAVDRSLLPRETVSPLPSTSRRNLSPKYEAGDKSTTIRVSNHLDNGLPWQTVSTDESGAPSRPTSKSSSRYHSNGEDVSETVKIMKFSELNAFLKDNERRRGQDKFRVRISFHDFPYIKIKLQKVESAQELYSSKNGLVRNKNTNELFSEINDFNFNTSRNEVHSRQHNQVPPSQRISLDVARAIEMAKLPAKVETQPLRRSSIVATTDYLSSRKDTRRDSGASSTSSRQAHAGKRVHFEQKWIFDDGKFLFSENPHRCK